MNKIIKLDVLQIVLLGVTIATTTHLSLYTYTNILAMKSWMGASTYDIWTGFVGTMVGVSMWGIIILILQIKRRSNTSNRMGQTVLNPQRYLFLNF